MRRSLPRRRPPFPPAPGLPRFRAVGSGLTESIATLMAMQGAVNLAENRGWTVIGEAKLQSCSSTGIFGMECAATSYACKMPH
ncbi:MAG: hypothetical protein WDN31_17895 [Hyphomicrobium sp.]